MRERGGDDELVGGVFVKTCAFEFGGLFRNSGCNGQHCETWRERGVEEFR
jgi:hypothetical protein